MLNIRNNLTFRLAAIGAVVAIALAAVAVPLSARANVFSNGRVESIALTSTPGNGAFYASGDVVTVTPRSTGTFGSRGKTPPPLSGC